MGASSKAPVSRVPYEGSAALEMREAEDTARTLGLEEVTSEIRRSEDIAPAFDAIKGRVEALYVCNDPLANADTRAVPSSTTSLVALAGRWV